MRQVTIAPRARLDLTQITRWLTQPGAGPVATGRLRRIRDAIDGLADHPCRFPSIQYRGIRELPCGGGYRAFYRVRPDTGRDETAGEVIVLRVFGPGQSRSRL